MAEEKWVQVEDYLGTGTLDQQKDRMSRSSGGGCALEKGRIYTVEMKASGPNHLPEDHDDNQSPPRVRAHDNHSQESGRRRSAGPHV